MVSDGDEDFGLDDIRAYVDSQRWVFAKTMADNPHEYVVLRKSTDPVAHMKMRDWMRRHGREERYRNTRWWWCYLDLDDWTYWVTRSDPAPDGDVWTIINRRLRVEEYP